MKGCPPLLEVRDLCWHLRQYGFKMSLTSGSICKFKRVKKIAFLSLCHHFFFLLFSLPTSDQKKADLLTTLHYLQTLRVVAPVHLEEWFQGFYSNLFTVPKPNGGICQILDLKSQNRFLCVENEKKRVHQSSALSQPPFIVKRVKTYSLQL